MEPLPPGGIEDAESDSRPDPARNPMEDPYVRYTVKELIIRIDTRLDTYIKQQDELRQTMDHIAPAVTALDSRVESLELAALKKAAVSDWRRRGIAAIVGSSGLLSVGTLIFTFAKH
jgi:hypothetical protein